MTDFPGLEVADAVPAPERWASAEQVREVLHLFDEEGFGSRRVSQITGLNQRLVTRILRERPGPAEQYEPGEDPAEDEFFLEVKRLEESRRKPRPRPQLSARELQILALAHARGMSMSKVAQRFDVSLDTVRRAVMLNRGERDQGGLCDIVVTADLREGR